MEIAHGSHEHPLFFTDGDSEDNQDEPVICRGCKDLICGPRFSCFACRFHLHKSCADLPPRLLGHPLHPQHPLSLLFAHPIPTSLSQCHVCNRKDIFVYHCSQCNFDIDIICALSVDLEGNVVSESTGEQDYFRYGLHQHLLVLEEDQSSSLERDGVDCCFMCSESISAPFFFCSRLRCKFQIHKLCANLPKQIKNGFLHPERSFFLVHLDTYNNAHCQMCGQKCKSFYFCLEPDLAIHPKCAFSNPRDTMTMVGEKQIQHRSHLHNLTLLEDEKDWAWTGNDDDPSCSLCMKQFASSPSYGCELCKTFIIHKSCAELPGQIKSHLHPKHSLILFATTTEGIPTLCDCCGTNVSKLNYCCIQCGFTLHVDCFLSLHDSERRYDHEHIFVDIKTFRELACDACGMKNYFSPWQCTACHVMVHKKCSELPRFLRIERHSHDLKLTYYLSVVHECDKLICQVCYRGINVDYAVYFCRLCKYAIHLSCGQRIGVAVSEEETQDDSLPEGHNSIGSGIKHFSHEHELTLNEQDPEEHKYCEGCVRIISSPFYNCKDCGFYLHKQCAEMPERNRFPFHPSLVQLNLAEKLQICGVCRNLYNGFTYSNQLQDFSYNIDFHCAKLMEGQGVDHPCHEHRLYFPDPKLGNFERCKSCGLGSLDILVCSECKYVLGFCCAKLSHKVRHRHDEHLLSLVFKMKDDEFDKYYCDICEYEGHPENWFYCCTQCDFLAHVKCAAGEYPFVKFGTTYKFLCHDHPLTYVEERKPPPLCHACGQHCYSRLLECRTCSFNVHFTDSCLEENLKLRIFKEALRLK